MRTRERPVGYQLCECGHQRSEHWLCGGEDTVLGYHYETPRFDFQGRVVGKHGAELIREWAPYHREGCIAHGCECSEFLPLSGDDAG